MIKRNFAFYCFLMLFTIQLKLQAQSVSPQVIASAGGYQANGIGSLSFTIGETVTQTFESSNNMLTQGFQQPFKATLNLKLYLQGYYANSGFMENVLFNQGVTAMLGTECDTIEIQLRQSTPPYNIVSTSKSILQTNGTANFSGNANLGELNYIVIKHRNTIESWSANPVLINENTYYDFSVGSNQVFGSNQSEVENGVWALYTGDINQDENIDLLDLGIVDGDINNFTFGFFATDINGDGNVDLLDNPIVEGNVNGFVFAIKP